MNQRETRFRQIDQAFAKRIADQFATPTFVMDESLLLCRFEEMRDLAKSQYPYSDVAISYKTNPTRSLLAPLHHRGALAEVVSSDEYHIARSLGVLPDKIIFNGPAKSNAAIEEAIQSGSYLHCDHEDEVARIEQISQRLGVVANIGVRLYFPSDDSWERFGFLADPENRCCSALSMIGRISNSPSLALKGLHAHIGTNIRDLTKFENFATVYAEFAEVVRNQFGVCMDWIDVGGGLAGISPRVEEEKSQPHSLPSISEYLDSIVAPLKPYLESCPKPPRLLFEPGRTLFNAAGALFTTVVGRRPADSGGIESVILDAGVTSLALAFKYDYPVHLCRPAGPETKTVRLLGPTCMEQDVVRRSVELPTLVPGDQLVIYGTGCYSMALASSFTHFRLGVIGWGDGDQLRWLRMPETLEHSQRLDVVEAIESGQSTTRESLGGNG